MKREVIQTNEEKFVIVIGPVRIHIKSGCFEANGVVFSDEEELVVHRSRSYLTRICPNSIITFDISEEGELLDASVDDIVTYNEWRGTANRILDECGGIDAKKCIILIAGESDTGKTTFSALVGNTAYSMGLTVDYIDADIGQSTSGNPGFIVLSQLDKPTIWPRDVKPYKMHFIGRLSPVRVQDKVITGILKLLGSSSQGSIAIIDTDGWIKDPNALAYKYELVRNIEPHVTVLIDETGELDAFGRSVEKVSKVYKIRPPPKRKERDRLERRFVRSEPLVRLQLQGKNRVFQLGEVFLIGAFTIGYGKPLNDEQLVEISRKIGTKVIFAESVGGKINAITKGRASYKSKEINIIEENWLKQRLVSIVGEKGEDVGPGIIEGISSEKKAIIVKTEFLGRAVGLRIGYIKVSNDIFVETE